MRIAELKQLDKKTLVLELLKQKQEINELKKEVKKQCDRWRNYYRRKEHAKN